MKNPTEKSIFIFMILLLVIAGCKEGSGRGTSITDEDVRKGFDGLTIEFTKNAPPDRVFEGDEDNIGIFPIGLNLKNKGADDIDQGEGFISIGLEKAYIDFAEEINEQIKFDIKGKSIFNLNGDQEFITLNAKAKKIGSQSETHPSTILATACYNYKTVLGTSVCIDPDIFGERLRDKACEVKDLEFKNGQGAPVTITKIETRMFPTEDENQVNPHFIIHVENKGNGEVIYQKRIEDACTNKPLEYKDFNKINIRVFLSNEEKELNCKIGEDTGGTEIRLREKKDIVRCTLKEGIERNRDAYTSPLKIELDYGYTFTISKDITIEKILTY